MGRRLVEEYLSPADSAMDPTVSHPVVEWPLVIDGTEPKKKRTRPDDDGGVECASATPECPYTVLK